MPWEGMERRKFSRVSRPCMIRLKRKEEAEVFSTTTENISCGGVCIILPKDLGVYTPIELELDLEDRAGKIKCEAIVVWSIRRRDPSEEKQNFFDVGVEFSNLEVADRERIEKFVEKCLKEKQ